MRLLVIFFVLLVLLESCRNEQSFDVDRLKGTWIARDHGDQFVETWKTTATGEMSGTGSQVSDMDTTVNEYLKLGRVNGILSYVPTVVGQNHGEAVVFPVTLESENVVEFMNKDHDFPQVIRYEMTGPDSMLVTVGNFPLDKTEEKFSLHFGRQK
jgi:hypothetical protein